MNESYASHEATEYVLFACGIDEKSVNDLVTVLRNVSAKGNDVYLAINSPGGNVNAGIYCYNMIQALPLTVTTHNVGHVDSISNVIFLAGTPRFTCPSATFLFHGVTFSAPDRVGIGMAKGFINGIEADHRRIAKIIAAHTSISFETATEMMEAEKVHDATWAMNQGIVSDVKDFCVPSTHSIHILA